MLKAPIGRGATGRRWFAVGLVGILACVLLAAGMRPAAAQALDAPCANAPNNAAYKDCLNGLLKQADRQLNEVWKRVLDKIARADFPEAKQRRTWKNELTAAQRAWLDFRHKDCGTVLYEYWGGSGVGGFMTLCQLKHTRDRIDHLRARFDLAGVAAAAAYPFLGRWATKLPEQQASFNEVCARSLYGHLEITTTKVLEYESDCTIKKIEKGDGKYHIQAACFAEGEDFSAILTVEMLKGGAMRVVKRLPKWGKTFTHIYRRCP